MAVMIFLIVVGMFASYCYGKSNGYEESINHEEKKKGIRQYSRMLWNEKY